MRAEAESELRELRARLELDSSDAGSGPSLSPVGPVVLSVGAASAIASAITGALALARDADARQGCENARCPAELGPVADEARTLAIVTDALLFGGLAVAAAGLVLTIVLPGSSDTRASASCTGNGCGLRFEGSF